MSIFLKINQKQMIRRKVMAHLILSHPFSLQIERNQSQMISNYTLYNFHNIRLNHMRKLSTSNSYFISSSGIFTHNSNITDRTDLSNNNVDTSISNDLPKILETSQSALPVTMDELVTTLAPSLTTDQTLTPIGTFAQSQIAEASATLSHTMVTSEATNVMESSDAYGWLSGNLNFIQSVACSTPVLKMMDGLQGVHEITGLPWWFCIVLTSVALRSSVTLPLGIYQQYIVAKVELLKQEMADMSQFLLGEARSMQRQKGWNDATAQLYLKQQSRLSWRELVERDNCHPGKGIVIGLIQLPLWVMLTIAVRNLCTGGPFADQAAVTTYQQLAVEGLPWCANLTQADPWMMMPACMVLINLAMTEINFLQHPQPPPPMMRRVNNLFRATALVIFPIAIFMPSGVVLYWMTSSSVALCQLLLVQHPELRRVCGIPVTRYTHAQPYRRIAGILRARMTRTEVSEHSPDAAVTSAGGAAETNREGVATSASGSAVTQQKSTRKKKTL